ncbi:MAG TPA: FCD domain-containing protein [Paenarthrobacter sp.]|nr:FCD domain-containing protein [Paenarthrobacter sp.]
MNERAMEEGTVSVRALEMVTQIRDTGELDTSSRADHVSQQLEAAIGIGILNSGERLPPENVLAEHLGVSPLTLRQALAVLRTKGLMETRRGGRSPGSYVSGQVEVSDTQINRRLRDLRTAELRDAVDLAVIAARGAARMGAQRADSQDILRIRALNERFAAASGPAELRRADSRLHIGLGVAAQSRKLTALLIQVQAELAPLSWPSEDAGRRKEAAYKEHEALITAMSRGDTDEAEDLAAAHFEEEGVLLIDRHLALLTAGSEAL